jgi:thioesterase domain-containing protein/acyl carrier protein
MPSSTSSRASGEPERPEAAPPGVVRITAPRSALEAELLRIWWDVLDEDRIGVTDDFFDLGGDSLGAVRLLEEIERRLGQRLPLSSMLESSTIERQAALLRDGAPAASWRSLVPLRAGRGGPTVAFVAAADGHVLSYRPLARYLDLPWPVVALQAAGLDGESPVRLTVEAMADGHVRELRQACPGGPYVLAGYSFGGLVAYEMARQLVQAGLPVPLLVLLDAHRPTLGTRLRRHLARAAALGPRAGLAHLVGGALTRGRRRAAARARERDARAGRPVRLTGRRREMEEIADAAAWRYAPRPHAGRVVIAESRQPSARLWRGLVAPPPEVHRVDCDHVQLLGEPHVRAVAALLRAALETVALPAAPGGERSFRA